MMYATEDDFMYTMKLACDMAKTTIKDIHKSADGEALTSAEIDDLHHALEVIKDVYVAKEMHMAWVESQTSAACMHSKHD